MDYRGTNGNDVIDQAVLALPDWSDIYGDAGDDFITIGNSHAIGGAGNDTIAGTAGKWSTVAYWSSPAGVVVNLQIGKAQDGFGTVDTLKNISVVQDSGFDDQLTGSSANETFRVSRGNNTIVGGGGVDTVYYYGQKSTDASVTYNVGTETFTILKNFTDGDRGTDILSGISIIYFIGSGSDNISLNRKAFAAEGGFLRKSGAWSIILPPDAFESQFKTGDFNGDGFADFLVATQKGLGTAPSPMYVFLGDGAGRFADGTKTLFSSPPMNIVGGGRTLIADFNRDGISDAFQLNFGIDTPPFPGGLNSLYLSSSATQKLVDVSASLVQQTALNHALSAGDVNGDGFVDVLVNTLSLGNVLYLNDGTGHFVLRQDLMPHPTTGSQPSTNTASGIVDVNGDGSPDLVLGRWDGGSSASASQVLLNDGTGQFTKFVPINLPSSGVPLEIILDVKGIDLNGDRLTDLILSISNGHANGAANENYYKTAYIQLLVNQGNGKFTDETATRLPASVQSAFAKGWFTALTSVDIDRDGYTDIIATGSGGGASVVLMNRGDGTFYQSWASEVGGATVAADVNGDGMLDLLTNVGSNIYVDINKLTNGHIYKSAIDGNHLRGSIGNDRLFGGVGNDAIDGGDGTDTVIITGNRTNYSISPQSSGYVVRAKSGEDGTHTLTNVERLKFNDFSVALDIAGSAGVTAKTLGAVFGKDAVANKEYAGIGLRLLDGGMNYLDLMQAAINAKLGVGANNTLVVELLYTNVVGTAPSVSDLDLYEGLLNSGAYTPASLGVLAANTVLNAVNVNLVGLTVAGLEYFPVG